MLIYGSLWGPEDAGRKCNLKMRKVNDTIFCHCHLLWRNKYLFLSENCERLKLYSNQSLILKISEPPWLVKMMCDLTYTSFGLKTYTASMNFSCGYFYVFFFNLLKLFVHVVLSLFILLSAPHMLNAMYMLKIQRIKTWPPIVLFIG